MSNNSVGLDKRRAGQVVKAISVPFAQIHPTLHAYHPTITTITP